MNLISIADLVLAALLLVAAGNVAQADTASQASACYNLPGDARAACLARVHNDLGRCYSVQDAAKRVECFSQVRK